MRTLKTIVAVDPSCMRWPLDIEVHFELLRVWNLVRRNQPGAYGAEAIEALALDPLS